MAGDIAVSVCMVTFNHEKYISQAIDGVLMQKGNFSLNLIIGDDASTDKTAEICKEYVLKYPEKVSFFRNEANKGPALNFCLNLKKATGNYIAFCEGDDYWTAPGKLEKQVSFLQNNPEYNICFHKVSFLLPDGRFVDDFVTKVPGNETALEDLIHKGNYMHTPSVVLRNNIVIPEWYLNCPVGDYPLYLLAAKCQKIKYFDESMAIYRYGVGAYSSLSTVKRRRSFFMTVNELTRKFPDSSVRSKMIRNLRREFHVAVKEILFSGSGDWKDLVFFVTKLLSTEFRHALSFFFNKLPGQNNL